MFFRRTCRLISGGGQNTVFALPSSSREPWPLVPSGSDASAIHGQVSQNVVSVKATKHIFTARLIHLTGSDENGNNGYNVYTAVIWSSQLFCRLLFLQTRIVLEDYTEVPRIPWMRIPRRDTLKGSDILFPSGTLPEALYFFTHFVDGWIIFTLIGIVAHMK